MGAYNIALGSTTYSATRDGDGVALAWDNGELGLEPPATGVPQLNIQADGAELSFFLTVVGSSESNLATTINAIAAKVVTPSLADDVVVKDGATTLFTLSTNNGDYSDREGAVEVYPTDGQRAVLRVSITFSGRDFGDGTDQIFSPARVEAERTISGLLGITLSADFFSTNSKTAYDAAQDWVLAIRNRVTAPALFPFLPATTELRVVGEPVFNSLERVSGVSSRDKVTATVLLREIDPSLTSLNAIWRHAEYAIDVAPVTAPLRYQPGFLFTINGRLEAKTAGNTSFDSSDSAPGYPSESDTLAALEVIVNAAQSRANLGSMKVTDVRRTSAGVGGTFSFYIEGIAESGPNPVLSADERVTFVKAKRVTRVVDTSGRIWNYRIPGFVESAIHTLTVIQIGEEPTYSRPIGIPGNFELTEERRVVTTPQTRPIYGLVDEGSSITVYGVTFEYTYEDSTGTGSSGRGISASSFNDLLSFLPRAV